MRFMGRKTKHNEICIGPINAMCLIRIISWRISLSSDVVQDFMLSLHGNSSIRKNYFQIFPIGVVFQILANVEFKLIRKLFHEDCPRSDYIVIPFLLENLFLIYRHTHVFHFFDQFSLFFMSFLDFLGCSESSSSLLIHLCFWSNSIYSKVYELFRFSDFHE